MDTNNEIPVLGSEAKSLLSRLTKPVDETAFKEREEAERSKASQQRVRQLSLRLGKRYSPALASLETFKVSNVEQKSALDRVKAILADLKTSIEEGRGLLLYGSVGTGKDHLLAAMLYAATLAGFDCQWVNGQEIFSSFRDNMDSGERESTLMSRFVTPHVLGISDPIPPLLDPNKPNAWRAELLYRVLDARYRDCKPTWVTLNAKSPEDADAKLSEPVFDRLQDKAEFIACFWPSYRERKKP